MFRRIIISYALSLTAGIVSGYILFEKMDFLWGGLFVFSCASLISRIRLDAPAVKCKSNRIQLIGFMILGLTVLALNYTALNRPLVMDGKAVTCSSVSAVKGRIVDVKPGEEKVVLIVKPENIEVLGRVRCSIKYDDSLSYYEMLGTYVEMNGRLREPSQADNPGCFNYRLYLKSRRIRYTFSAGNISDAAERTASLSDRYWSYRRWILLKREEYLNRFDNPEIRSLIKGIIFGDKSDIDDETIEEFNTNSTGHILAVSGLHIGFIYTLLQVLTGKSKTAGATCLVIVILFLYGEMTKWNPSTIRAVIVMCINLMSIYVKRRFDLVSSVCASAIIILVWNPYQLFNAGFQMSYLALLGIGFFSGPMEMLIGRYFGSLTAVQLAVSPMIASTFYRFNIISLLINIPVVMIASWLVPLAISGLAAEIVLGVVPGICIQGAVLMTQLLVWLNSMFAVYAGTDIDATGINPGLLICIFLIIFLIASEWFRVRYFRNELKYVFEMLSWFIIPALSLVMSFSSGLCHDQITFVSVGQGDCTHISAGSIDIMIDGGGSSDWNTGRNILKPYLLYRGVRDLDAAFVTHLHTDHFKGLEELSQIYNIHSLGNLTIGETLDVGERITVEAVWPLKSERINLNRKNAEILRLLSEESGSEDKNENNTVYIVNYDGVRIMITGDMEADNEHQMVEHYQGTDILNCQILKVGHHGSQTSTTDELLDAVRPQICIISVGLNNRYGHPHQEVLDRLETRDIPVYRTDLQGAVGFRIRNGRIVRVDTMR